MNLDASSHSLEMYLLHWRAARAQMSLHIQVISTEQELIHFENYQYPTGMGFFHRK